MTAAARLMEASLETSRVMRLHPTTVTIRTGAVTAIVGPNGSGKSSLLGLLAGDLTASRGRVLLGDRDVAQMRPRERAQARALLSQDRQVSFGFTAEEVISWGRSAWRGSPAASDDRRIIDEVIERQGLEALRRRPVTMLSGGERTRVHLARVLAQQASLLLLDEADADLDLVGRHILDSAVHSHVSAGGSAVVISHDISRVRRTSDDAIVMSHGRVLAHGPASDVLTNEQLSAAFGIPVDLA